MVNRWPHANAIRRDRRRRPSGRLGLRVPSARLERSMDRRRHHGMTRVLFQRLEAFWGWVVRGVR
jgi:hypothetical protein